MNHIFFIALPLALTLLTVSACSSRTSPTSPSSIAGSTALTADVLGSTWRLRSIRKAGQAEQASPAGADYTLTFSDRLSLRADCNSCSSSYSFSGTTISVGSAMACTRAYCQTAAFADSYLSILGGDSQIAVSGSTLTLSSPRGTLQLVRN